MTHQLPVVMKSGTLRELIVAAVQSAFFPAARKDARAFVHCYRSHCSPMQLWRAILAHFDTQNVRDPLRAAYNERLVVAFLFVWLHDCYRRDFFANGRLMCAVRDYLLRVVVAPDHYGCEANACKLIILRSHLEASVHMPLAITPSGTLRPETSRLRDLDVLWTQTPAQIADALTFGDTSLLLRIQTVEFDNCAWSSPDRDTLAPNLCALSHRFNTITQWVSTAILTAPETKRIDTVRRLCSVLDKLVEQRNYQTATAFSCGFNHNSVVRLRKLWADAGLKARESVDFVDELMSPLANYRAYRPQIDKPTAYIPLMAVLLRDLTFIADGNSTYVKGPDGEPLSPSSAASPTPPSSVASALPAVSRDKVLNWERMMLWGNQMAQFLTAQSRLRGLKATTNDAAVLGYFANPYVLDEDQLWEKSQQCEPSRSAASRPQESPAIGRVPTTEFILSPSVDHKEASFMDDSVMDAQELALSLPPSVADWSVMNVADWVSAVVGPVYVEFVQDSMLDGPALIALKNPTDDQLVEKLGLYKLGHRLDFKARLAILLDETRPDTIYASLRMASEGPFELRVVPSIDLARASANAPKLPSSIRLWTADELARWLRYMDINTEIIDILVNEAVDGAHFLDLTPDSMEELGIFRLGHRLNLADQIAALRDASSSISPNRGGGNNSSAAPGLVMSVSGSSIGGESVASAVNVNLCSDDDHLDSLSHHDSVAGGSGSVMASPKSNVRIVSRSGGGSSYQSRTAADDESRGSASRSERNSPAGLRPSALERRSSVSNVPSITVAARRSTSELVTPVEDERRARAIRLGSKSYINWTAEDVKSWIETVFSDQEIVASLLSAKLTKGADLLKIDEKFLKKKLGIKKLGLRKTILAELPFLPRLTLEQWTTMRTTLWLKEVGLEAVTAQLSAANVDGAQLLRLHSLDAKGIEAQLRHLGVAALGHIKKFISEISELVRKQKVEMADAWALHINHPTLPAP